MFEQFFASPQMKKSLIISNKHDIHELPYELPNDLRLPLKTRDLRKLGNISETSKLHKTRT